ncbi:hypothetical protein AHAS_Ahas11G0270700 [Arachis hypogaea]
MNSNESIVGRRKKRWVSPKCYCGSDAVLFMSGTKSNPNRLFLRYPKFKTAEGCCSFFVWLDDYVSSFNEHFSKTTSKGVLQKNQQRFEGLSDAVDDKVEELEMRLIELENQLGKSRKKMGESRCLGLGYLRTVWQDEIENVNILDSSQLLSHLIGAVSCEASSLGLGKVEI